MPQDSHYLQQYTLFNLYIPFRRKVNVKEQCICRHMVLLSDTLISQTDVAFFTVTVECARYIDHSLPNHLSRSALQLKIIVCLENYQYAAAALPTPLQKWLYNILDLSLHRYSVKCDALVQHNTIESLPRGT